MARPTGAKGCNVQSAAMAKRMGRLSLAEQSSIQAAANGPLSVEKAAEKMAPVLGRSEEAMRKAIREAREQLQSRAGEYLELHLKATKKAAESGNARPAEWALERIEVSGERVITPPAASQEHSGIKIIIAPIAITPKTPAKELQAPVIEAEIFGVSE